MKNILEKFKALTNKNKALIAGGVVLVVVLIIKKMKR